MIGNRVTALLAVATLAAIVPGGTLAAADEPPTNAGLATPPPLPADWPLLADAGGPDTHYENKGGCAGSPSGSGQAIKEIPWAQRRLQLDTVHQFATGEGQLVAVIDTGVHPHEYFQGRLSGGGDYVTDAKGLEDCDAHGTEVAGIIAADTQGATGFQGVAPKARILSIRQSSAHYEGVDTTTGERRTAGTLDTLAMAIRRAVDAHATVINMSIDHCRPAAEGPITDHERNLQAAVHYAVEHDVVVVSSAGNLNENSCPSQNNGADPTKPETIVTPPWFADDVLSVGAIQESGDPAEFSVRGPWVSLGGPGTRITSLDPSGKGLTRGGTKAQETIQGTSFAAPYVAGVAALVRQRYPTLKARAVMERIRLTAQHPAAPGGRDDVVGFGMVNPMAALTQYIPAEDGVAPATATHPTLAVTPPTAANSAPMLVALIGTAGGLGLLLITMFVVHTARREKPRRHRA